MTIHIGTDHGGFALKEELVNFLHNNYFDVKDHGAKTLDPEDDYPQFAYNVATSVRQDPENVGILLCRSGGGVCIMANKVRGIRAVVVGTPEEAIHAREHNHAQVICISADHISDPAQAFQIVMAFLNSNYGEGRHARRVEQITSYEEQEYHSYIAPQNA